jgi:hypothetical protein
MKTMDQNLTAFLKIGDFAMMEDLRQRVESRMIRLLNQGNMVKFFLAGNKYNRKRVREKAKQVLRANRGLVGAYAHHCFKIHS